MTILKILSILILVQPLCAVVLGLLCWRCPPKGPTWAYGYRSRRARASDESWSFAQNFAGQLWFWLGLVLLIVALIICMGLRSKDTEAAVRTALIFALVQDGCIFLSMIPTEVLLLHRFDRFGRVRGSVKRPAPAPQPEYEATGRVDSVPRQEPYDGAPYYDSQDSYFQDDYLQDGYPQDGYDPDWTPKD